MVTRTTPLDAAATSAQVRGRPEVWMSGAYWWAFGAVGALGPFIALYYRELGMSGARVGLLAALPSVGVALLAPFWGAFADARSNHRLVLRIALVLTALAAVGLARAEAFWLVLVLAGMMALFSAPTPSILDSYGLAIAERRGASLRGGYGAIRVWGSLGYTVGVWCVGRWMGGEVSNAFLLAYAGCLLLAGVCTLGLPSMGERKAARVWDVPGAVLKNRPLLVLMLTAYLLSIGSTTMYSFLGIRLRELGGGADLIGAAFALNAASELPVVFFGSWFIARLGAVRLLVLAIVVYAARLAAYSVLPGADWVLPVQLLHGFSFGAFLLASVTLARGLAGPGLSGTALGLLSSMSFGFGSITGSLAGGAMLDRVGAVGVFRAAAIVTLIALGVFAAGVRAYGMTGERNDGSLPTQE